MSYNTERFETPNGLVVYAWPKITRSGSQVMFDHCFEPIGWMLKHSMVEAVLLSHPTWKYLGVTA